MTNELQTTVKSEKSKFRRTIRRMNVETLDSLGNFGYIPFHFLRGVKIGVCYLHEIPDFLKDHRQRREERLNEIQSGHRMTLSETVTGSDKPKTPDRYRYNNSDAWSVLCGALVGIVGCVISYAYMSTQENYRIALAIPLSTNLASIVHQSYKKTRSSLSASL